MIPPAYYRSLLSADQQEDYKALVNGLRSRSGSIRIHQHPDRQDVIRQIVRAVHLDHPELFYVDFWHYESSWHPLSRNVRLHFQMMLEPEPSQAVSNSLAEQAASLKKRLEGCASVERAYYLVAKEVASSTRYLDSNSAFWDHTVAGPILRHSAVCEGVAKLFLFFCQRVSLPCAIMTGTLHGTPHAWNLVERNGQRSHMDITGILQTAALFSIAPYALFQADAALRQKGYHWEDPRQTVPPQNNR